MVMQVRPGSIHAREVCGTSRDQDLSAQGRYWDLATEAPQSLSPQMAIQRLRGGIVTIVIAVPRGSSRAQPVSGRSRPFSPAQGRWTLLKEEPQSPLPPMAIRQSSVDRSTMETPDRRGPSPDRKSGGEGKRVARR